MGVIWGGEGGGGGEFEMTGFIVSNRADVMQISKNHQLAGAEGVIDIGIVLAEGYLLSFLKLLTRCTSEWRLSVWRDRMGRKCPLGEF